jgi:amidase
MSATTGLAAVEIARLVRDGGTTAVRVVQEHLDRIAAVGPTVGALPVVLAEQALAGAAEVDRRVAAGEDPGPLAGVPLSVKLNVDVAGSPTSHGVRALADAVPQRDAPVVERWRRAGAVVVGRGNMPDLALRWHSDNALHGATTNPWDPALSPGGSSGGEAVALATGMTALGLGNDYGGSLRLPALAAGVLSLRPTAGALPSATDLPPVDPGPTMQLFGVQGPMARTVDDLALAFDVARGRHPRDPLSLDAVLAPPAQPGPVAVLVDPAGWGVDDEVAAGVLRAADALRDAGHPVREIDAAAVADLVAGAAGAWLDLVVTDLATTVAPVMRDLGSADAVRFLDDFLALAPALDREGWIGALVRRHALLRGWDELTAEHPIVLGPVAADGVPPVGRDLTGPDGVRAMWRSHGLLVAVNLLGAPAVALPAGPDRRGIPTGVQLIGARHTERLLLAAARAVERAHPYAAPPASTGR